jgi:hypothetical protein
MTTAQLKALTSWQQQAYRHRVQFLREHGIALTPREQVEAQRADDRTQRGFDGAPCFREPEDSD